jgi:hypothetical protein
MSKYKCQIIVVLDKVVAAVIKFCHDGSGVCSEWWILIENMREGDPVNLLQEEDKTRNASGPGSFVSVCPIKTTY